MNESNFWLEGESGKLFCSLGYNSICKKRPKGGVIMCYPFAEERMRVHRLYRNLAKFISRIGYDVIRFDYWGQGDSTGDFIDSDVETRLADIHTVIEYMSARLKKADIFLFGFRLGANLALHAGKSEQVQGVILQDMIGNMEKYANNLLRLHLLTQMRIYGKPETTVAQLKKDIVLKGSINIEGYDMSARLFSQIAGMDAKKWAPANKRILFISPKGKNDIENELLLCLADQGEHIEFSSLRTPKYWNENIYLTNAELWRPILGEFFKNLLSEGNERTQLGEK